MLYSVVSSQIGFCAFLLSLHFQHTEANSLDHYNTSYVNRYRRSTQNANCPLKSFKCGSGDCIPEENVCDGTVECQDGSDELDDCRDKIKCTNQFLFQCKYGACIANSKKCDGKQDCRDNSDEILPECRSTMEKTFPNSCGFTKFRCDSGQCIDDSDLCDGVGNCDDKSDETSKACRKFNCPSLAYRCNYGACVSRNARCNGKQECLDGSDEKSCPGILTSTSFSTAPNVSPSVKQGCRFPNNPSHGKYTVINDPTAGYKPGDIVPKLKTILSLNCNRGYVAHPPSEENELIFYCVNSGKWIPSLRTCERTCPSQMTTKSTRIYCSLNGERLKTCTNPIKNTTAHISCQTLYEEQGLSQNPTRLCKNGDWDSPMPSCTAVCGIKRPKGVTNIISGTKAILGDYPWQVVVYAYKKHICGGSIINPRIVLSAAHCFADKYDRALPKEIFQIGAGKYYHQHGHPNDYNAQYSNVNAIHVPERYRGIISRYEADIAIIILSTPFNLSVNVQPVCIDYESYEDKYYSGNGIVTGWGYINEENERTEVLKELPVPYISYRKCFEEVPESSQAFITYDKICAGYLNKSASICEGDSGGPLVFPKTINSVQRYYLRGIVSTSPSNEEGTTCNSNQYGFYTSIAKHITYIRDVVTYNRI